MNIVLFLGAGFSAEFDLPVMDQFFPFAEDSKKLDENEIAFLSKLRREAKEANSFLNTSPKNLEDILSFSLMKNRLSYGLPSSKKDQFILRKILGKIYTKITHVDWYWGQFLPFKEFIFQYLENRNSHNLQIITTNYDLSIECALIKNDIFSNPIIKYDKFKMYDEIYTTNHMYKDDGIPLYKLHGSVNWFTQSNSKKLTIDDRLIRTRSGTENYSIPYVCKNNYYDKTNIPEPLIIPPSFLKPDLLNPLKKIWSDSSKALNEAHLIVFVGYSFPMTDIEMKYFFANSLSNNVNLRQIQIIDPNVEEIVKKINANDSKFGTHFKDLIRKNDNKWARTKIDLNV